MKIPSNNQWTQLNQGDIFGVLGETQNITLDKAGKIKLSRKAFNRYNSDDDANLGYILSIVYYGGQYFALTDDNAYRFAFGDSFVTEVSLTSDVGLNSDAVVCYDRVYISTNDNVDYFDGSLTAGVEALTANVPHPMCVFDSLPTYKLAIGDDNVVETLDSSNNANSTKLTLPAQYQITSLAYRNGYLYVATKHQNGGEAKVFIWDGNSSNANFEVPVGASWIYSIIPYKTSVVCMTNQGQLLDVFGNTPTQIAQLPVYDDPDAIWDDGTNVSYMGKVLHRGMAAVGDVIYMNINGTVDQGRVPGMKHGLWVYDPRAGLYHRASHSIDRSVVETPSALASNTLTLSTHNLKTGDVLIIRTVGSLTGVSTGTKYYVKVESATTVKLATSRKALQDEVYVSIGGAVGGSSVSYAPNTDWHGGYSEYQGAITAINPEEPIFKAWESPVIWGARIDDLDGNNVSCLMSLTDAWNIGWFKTQRIYSPNIKEVWKSITAFIDGVNLDNEEIIIKYKTAKSFGYPTDYFAGTWTSTTTFTTSCSLLQDGDEVVIVNGKGRGYSVHVSGTPTELSGTYTVTIDEAVGASSGSLRFYGDSFKKLISVTNARPDVSLVSQTINPKSAWVQIKVEMRGYETEVSHLELSHVVDKANNV